MNIGLLGTPRSIAPAVRPELLPHLPQGSVLSAWPSRVGVFPATPLEVAMQVLGHVDAGLSAAQAGVGAVVIDSVADYGLDALAGALAIPVVGAGQAGLAAAARVGRFAIVTVWPRSMNFVLDGQLARYGLQQDCLSIHNLADDTVIGADAPPSSYLREIGAAAPAIVRRVLAAIEAAASAGADAVMLGCTCMSPMAAMVQAGARIPVINPLLEGVRTAMAHAAAGSTSGLRTTRAGLVHRMVDAIAGEADDNCPVCVSSADFLTSSRT